MGNKGGELLRSAYNSIASVGKIDVDLFKPLVLLLNFVAERFRFSVGTLVAIASHLCNLRVSCESRQRRFR